MEKGLFLSILKEGEKPVEIYGERLEIRPKKFKKSVVLGLHRDVAPQVFTVLHFETGMKIASGKDRLAAIANAENFLEKFGELAFEEKVREYPVINTKLGTHYDANKQPQKQEGEDGVA